MTAIHCGDCLDVLGGMADDSIDAVVTDPPYGLAFMGKKWDYDIPGVDIWRECLRVLKPGGHLLSFAGTRTQHRMACAIEDAGFEIRDMIAWVYGSGFPKSLDVSKAIESNITNGKSNSRSLRATEQAGDGEPYTLRGKNNGIMGETRDFDRKRFTHATPAAEQWQGWGTALKPALEPITVARKPLIGTVAANVLEHGTGGINVDACRVGTFQNTTPSGVDRRNAKLAELGYRPGEYQMGEREPDGTPGRWPANLIHDGSDEVLGLFPSKAGSAARFFYCAKASKRDRDEGCEGIEAKRGGSLNIRTDNHSQANGMDTGPRRNHHPTVKPLALMRYLCRLVTPPGGTVLDPFMGSGSTGKAAALEGFGFIGIEREAEYVEIAKARIENAKKKYPLGV